jgi:hypothetical protein
MYHYRYERHLSPLGKPKAHALRFGSLYHAGLEAVFSGSGLEGALTTMQARCPSDTEESHEALGVAWAMLRGYVQRWPDDDFGGCRPEVQFDVPLRNTTGRPSRSFRFAGKIDLLAPTLIMEHKTAQRVDHAYLEALWADAQITGYTYAARQMGYAVSRVIYDVVVKPTIRRGEDEPLDHYLTRIEELYVGGYSAGRAKRRKDESDEAWWDRRRAEGEPVDMFHREDLIVGERQIAEWQADLWDVTQEILWARRNGRYPRSTARCYDWGRPCDYVPICQSLGSEDMIIASEYETTEAHPELSGSVEVLF